MEELFSCSPNSALKERFFGGGGGCGGRDCSSLKLFRYNFFNEALMCVLFFSFNVVLEGAVLSACDTSYKIDGNIKRFAKIDAGRS